jgi:hypothetical protein
MGRSVACGAIAVSIALLVSACASSAAAPVPPTSNSTAAVQAEATATPTPTPSPTPTLPAVPTSPLTGLPQPTAGPVLVVKLDNTHNAQPHAGLNQADLVYIEEVEYGITRLAAVFSSTVPDRIGPVRSARITDIDLLAQYGSPAFAFSGAQRKLWPALAAATMIDISPNKGADSYGRDSSRRAPYNYFLDGGVGLSHAPKATLDHDMGFVFSTDVPLGGLPMDKARATWGESQASFNFDPDTGLYRVSLNGERAHAEENDRGQNAATVIIQNVKQRQSQYWDKGGGNTPHAQTIGTGTATVLRDGLAWEVTWSRPDAESGTTFTRADGTPMTFKPGQQWIVLLNARTPARFTAPAVASALESSAASASSTAMASPSPSRG